jgi:hypothetical protein
MSGQASTEAMTRFLNAYLKAFEDRREWNNESGFYDLGKTQIVVRRSKHLEKHNDYVKVGRMIDTKTYTKYILYINVIWSQHIMVHFFHDGSHVVTSQDEPDDALVSLLLLI